MLNRRTDDGNIEEDWSVIENETEQEIVFEQQSTSSAADALEEQEQPAAAGVANENETEQEIVFEQQSATSGADDALEEQERPVAAGGVNALVEKRTNPDTDVDSVASSITHDDSCPSDADALSEVADDPMLEDPIPVDRDESRRVTELEELVETLRNMGFSSKRIERALNELLDSGGALEIDADSVIGAMEEDRTLPDQTPTGWDFVDSTVHDLGQQMQTSELRRRTGNGVRALGQSARQFWTEVVDESDRARSRFQTVFDNADEQARETSTQIRYAAATTKDRFVRANEEHNILDKVATAAAVAGGLALCLGNPRAGLGAVAVAGSAVAVNETLRTSPVNSTYTRDVGLSEDLHLD